MGIPEDSGYGIRTVILLLILVGSGACAHWAGIPPLPEGWTREALHLSRSTRSRSSQHLRFATEAGPIELRGSLRQYSPNEIPGWERPFAERVGAAIAGFGARRVGLTTDDVVVGHGGLVVSSPSAELELRCTVFWIADQDVEYDRGSNVDQVASTSLRTRGMDCHGAHTTQPEVTVWRFNYGIAPPFDSVAALYDALDAIESPAVAVDPPVTLARLASDGVDEARYDVHRDEVWIRIGGPDGRPMAVLYNGVDFAPAVGPEEKALLRMIAIALNESGGR